MRPRKACTPSHSGNTSSVRACTPKPHPAGGPATSSGPPCTLRSACHVQLAPKGDRCVTSAGAIHDSGASAMPNTAISLTALTGRNTGCRLHDGCVMIMATGVPGAGRQRDRGVVRRIPARLSAWMTPDSSTSDSNHAAHGSGRGGRCSSLIAPKSCRSMVPSSSNAITPSSVQRRLRNATTPPFARNSVRGCQRRAAPCRHTTRRTRSRRTRITASSATVRYFPTRVVPADASPFPATASTAGRDVG